MILVLNCERSLFPHVKGKHLCLEKQLMTAWLVDSAPLPSQASLGSQSLTPMASLTHLAIPLVLFPHHTKPQCPFLRPLSPLRHVYLWFPVKVMAMKENSWSPPAGPSPIPEPLIAEERGERGLRKGH